MNARWKLLVVLAALLVSLPALAATSVTLPAHGAASAGSFVAVPVTVDTGGAAFTSLHAVFTYPSSALVLKGLYRGGVTSAFTTLTNDSSVGTVDVTLEGGSATLSGPAEVLFALFQVNAGGALAWTTGSTTLNGAAPEAFTNGSVALGSSAVAFRIGHQLTAAPAGTIDIPVVVDPVNAGEYMAFDLSLKFDPRVLQAVSVATTASTSGWETWSNYSNTAGTWLVSLFSTSKATGTGPQPIVTLHFDVVGALGNASPLEITEAMANDVVSDKLDDGLFAECAASGTGLTRYVDDTGTGPGDAANDCLDSLKPCRTITRALEAACGAFDTVQVADGSYAETLRVTKSVFLKGPNFATAGNDPARVTEAFLYPAVSGPRMSASPTMVMSVTADDVTVRGFTIDGNNPAITSGTSMGGVDVDAATGVVTGPDPTAGAAVSRLLVENNVIRNLTYAGVDLISTGTPAGGHRVDNNRFVNVDPNREIDGYGMGVALELNAYARVDHNVFTDVRKGVQMDNFWLPAPTGALASVDHNTITSVISGIWNNQQYGSATSWTIEHNTIGGTNTRGGIWLTSLLTTVGVQVIDHNAVTGGYAGLLAWNIPSTGSITVDALDVAGAQYGVRVDDNAYAAGDNGATLTVSHLAVTGATVAGAAVFQDPGVTQTMALSLTVLDSSLTASGSGNAALADGSHASLVMHRTLATGGLNGVLVQNGANANVSGNQIAGNTTGVTNSTSNTVDASCVWWGSAAGPGAGGNNGVVGGVLVNTSPWDIDTTYDNAFTYYGDADGDGFGIVSVTTTSCGSAPAGYGNVFGDCDDAQATVFPNAPELCDGIDNQCTGDLGAGEIDEGTTRFVATTGHDAVTSAQGRTVQNDCLDRGVYGPCEHIKYAVNGACAGNTVSVAGGTYAEDNINVTKALTLHGAGSSSTVIDASGSVMPGNVIDVNLSTGGVTATVEGFRVKNGRSLQGIAFHSAGAGGSTIVIQDNDVVGFGSGSTDGYDFGIIGGYGGLANVIVRRNHVGGTWGNPVLFERHAGASEVSNNTIDVPDDNSAIYYMTYNGLAITAPQRITDNTINIGSGSWGANAVVIEGAFEVSDPANRAGKFTDVQITGNTITNSHHRSAITLTEYSTDGTSGSVEGALIARNSITGAGTGNGRGIGLFGNVKNTTLRENVITNLLTGVGVKASYGAGSTAVPTGTSLFDNSVTSCGTGTFLDVVSTTTVDASGNWWGTADEAMLTPRITGPVDFTPWLEAGTDLDGTAAGFQGDFSILNVGATGQQYTMTGRIQEGVDLVSGSTVKVWPGTYKDNVHANKAGLILQGLVPGGVKPLVYPAISAPNPCPGSSLCGGAASNIVLVEANNVTIDSLVLDGANPDLTGGVTSGGIDVDARNGIIENHAIGVYNGTRVHACDVRNIYLRGVYASSGGSGFLIDANQVSNVAGEANSVAVMNFGGSGTISGNTVTGANDAICANQSTGTNFLDNIVTNSGSGVHTDNARAADRLEGNNVSNSTAGGYGVWVFVPYVAPLVKNNTITNVDVGLCAAASALPVTPRFEGNTVDCANRANSAAMYVTTSEFGWGDNNVSAELVNNTLRNADDGVYVEHTAGKSSTVTGSGNHVTTNKIGFEIASGSTTVTFNGNWLDGNTEHAMVNNATTGTVTAECDWWGASSGPATGQVEGTVDFLPYAYFVTLETRPWYPDADHDNYGLPGSEAVTACGPPTPNAYALTADDCDDTLAIIHPGAYELCDQLDNNCNGTLNDAEANASCNDANDCSTDTCSDDGACTYPASAVCGLSGHVWYNLASGTTDVADTAKPIDAETLHLTGDNPQDSATGSAGAYSFGSVGIHVTLTPGVRTGTSADFGALSGMDATLIAKHAVGLITLTPNNVVIGDVSNNGRCTSYDASLVAQKNVNPAVLFPAATAHGSDWVFFPASVTDTLSGSKVFDFIAGLYGDTTNSWPAIGLVAEDALAPLPPTDPSLVPLVPAPARTDAAIVYLASGPTRHEDGTWSVTLGLMNADGIQALDMRLHLDSTHVTVRSAQQVGLASRYSLVRNDGDNEHVLALYGLVPMHGTGEFLALTLAVDGPLAGSGFVPEIEANEGLVPIELAPGLRPATHGRDSGVLATSQH